MKIKVLILFLLFWTNSFAPNLPTTGLCLSDVLAVTGGTCLADAFTNANSSYFDPTYAVPGNCLDDFKNYGNRPTGLPVYWFYYNYSYLTVPSSANYWSGSFASFSLKYVNAENLNVGTKVYWDELVNAQVAPNGTYLTQYTYEPDVYYTITDGIITSISHPNGWSAEIPVVNNDGISNITGTSAHYSGSFVYTGGSSITQKGACWSTVTNPTIADSHTSDGAGAVSFSNTISGLTSGYTYYVRTYATNGIGTGYGAQTTFTTPVPPTVSSDYYSVTSLSEVSASGSISSDGGASITAKGYCWATTTNPTTSNSHTSDGTGTASWTSSITGLNGTTTYYARAYATNSAGTSYGSNLTINTALYSTAYAELNTVRIGTSNQDLDVTYYSTNPEGSNKSVKIRIQNVSKSSGWIEGSLFTSYSSEYRISRSGTISMGVTNAEGDSFDIQYSPDGGSTWTGNISVPNSKTIPY